MNFIKNHDKIWNFNDISSDINLDNAFFLGAGASSKNLSGDNCELIPNTNLGKKKCLTKSAEVSKLDNKTVILVSFFIYFIFIYIYHY